MTSTEGNIDAVVGLYGQSEPPERPMKQNQEYYNDDPSSPKSSPSSPQTSPPYYNRADSRESYLAPVVGDPVDSPTYDTPKPRPPAASPPGSVSGSRRRPQAAPLSTRQRQENAGLYNSPQPTISERVPATDAEVRLPLAPSSARNSPAGSSTRIHQYVNVPESNVNADKADPDALQYLVRDVPPWYLCIFLGFQHYLVMFGATVANPLVMAPVLCIADDDNVAKSELIATIMFVSGIATLLQTFLGVRLPIVQGGTFTFIAPSMAIMSLPQWKCPVAAAVSDVTTTSSPLTTTMEAVTGTGAMNVTDMEPLWLPRIRELQGAIMVASLFQVLVGFTGIMGFLLRWIGPLAIAPTIALAGLALFDVASAHAAKQWWITLVTVILIAMFSQYTKNIKVPCCKYERGLGFAKTTFPLFRLFPIILAIAITWLICLILTLTGVFPSDSSQWGYGSKTDLRIDVLKNAPWFRVPYPGQWGLPTVSFAGVFGMLSGVLASMIESVGDYYACARISKAPPPPMHAVNRGIGMEGIGCIIAGAFGSGSGTTSYSENIGAIGITKVASRSVIQVAACFMLIFGVCAKFGAIFVTIPDPIIGGVFIVMFGMVTAVGISNLQFVDMNSSRNLFIIGFSFFFGLTLPKYLKENPNSIQTGSEEFDQIVTVLLRTSMFVGGMSGFILDNTIPGTDEERGLTKWRELLIKKKKSKQTPNKEYYKQQQTIYEIPLLTRILKRWNWTRYVPFLPTFDEELLNIKSRLPGRKRKHVVNDDINGNGIQNGNGGDTATSNV